MYTNKHLIYTRVHAEVPILLALSHIGPMYAGVRVKLAATARVWVRVR